MKNTIFNLTTLTLILLVITSNVTLGQIAGSSSDLSEWIHFTEKEKPKLKKDGGTNPEDDAWPKCAEPKNVQLEDVKGDYILTWDRQEANTSYEIELFYEDEGVETISKKYKTQKNKYTIPNEFSRSDKNYKVRIRRICTRQQGNNFYSDWVILASVVPCNLNLTIFGSSRLCPDSVLLNTNYNSGFTYLWSTTETTPSITVFSTGTYSVTVTQTNTGCTATKSKTIEDQPNISIPLESAEFCNTSHYTISADLLPNTTGFWNSFQWYVAPIGTENWTLVTNDNPAGIYYNGLSSSNLTITPNNPNVSGNFKYKLKGVYYCSDVPQEEYSNSILISIQNCDCTSQISPFQIECPTEPFTLTASEGSAFAWSHGPTSRVVTLDPPSQNTTYIVTVTCDSGGTSTASALVIVDGCSGDPYATIDQVICKSGTTDYQVYGTLHIEEPNSEEVVIHDYEGNIIVTVQTNSSDTSYTFLIDDITPDNQVHYIYFSGGGFFDYEKYYHAPSQCLNVSCNIFDVVSTPGECTQPGNEYNLDVDFSVASPIHGEFVTVSITGYTDTKTIMLRTGITEYSTTFEGLGADGSDHQVSITSVNCNFSSGTYLAPNACAELPDAECGDPYTLPTITNTELLQSCIPGNIVTVAGIPFKVTNVKTEQNETFTGEGQLSIPFSEKPLKVTFNNLRINTDFEVIGGKVKGVREAIAPNFNIPNGTINFGGDICVVDPPQEGQDEDGFDKVTGLNDRGFGRDSLYYPDSTKYDPNGYDFNGLHRDTGTKFDKFGCDMNGLDENGQACVRDSVIKAFIDQQIPLLDGKIDTSINEILGDLDLKMTQLNCDSIRNVMMQLIRSNSFDSTYIVGSNKEYLNEGMSTLFTEEPKPLLDNSNRDPQMISLEKDHVNLYKCDAFMQKYGSILEKLDTADREKIKGFVKNKLKELTRDQVNLFKNEPEKFTEWIMAMILEYFDTGADFGSVNKKHQYYDYSYLNPPVYTQDQTPSNNPFQSVSDIENEPWNYENRKMTKNEKLWLFEQGFREIDGVSRGLYLEQLYYNMIAEGGSGGANSNETLLPIALVKSKDANAYNIYLDNIVIDTSGASLDAYFVYQDPNSDKKFVMEAQNLNWGLGGMIGQTQLNLKSEVEIRLSNAAMLRLLPVPAQGQGGCFVTWDCSGFQNMGIDAEIELCPDMILPLDTATLEVIPDERYSIQVSMVLESWSDFYFEINGADSIRPFTTPNNKEMKWVVSHIAVDMSDARSPQNVQMFPGYISPLYNNGSFAKEWRGFYMGELSVTMPNSFSTSNESITVGVEDVVIDDMGVSGTIFGENILPIEDGSLGGWPFSIDEVHITVLHNNFLDGGMAGLIKVPVFKDTLSYAATVSANKYIFTVAFADTLQKMDALLADVTLFPETGITVGYIDDEFVAVANLTGKMNIKGGDSISVDFPEIRFSNFRVSNQAPYFDAGIWQVENNISATLFGFKVDLKNITPFSPSSGELGIAFDLNVTLPGQLSAGGGFSIIGALGQDSRGRQKWEYDRFEMNSFSIDVEFSAGHIKGYLKTFKGHPTFGKGFQGRVSMKFKALGEIDCMALFGNTGGENPNKYFFIDASVDLVTGIPAGPLTINGFVGGVAYHMRVIPPTTYNGSNPTGLPPIGQSLSGAVFTPDSSYGLYLKAGVKLALASKKEAFNGIVSFDILFNSESKGGGVASMGLEGKGQFMNFSEITGSLKLPETDKPLNVSGALTAHIRISYDFNNDVFTGKIIAFLDIANVIYGAGQNKKMVDAEIHISKEKWYIYIGTPQSRCGITANILIATVNLKAYLDIGSIIPDLPDLPDNVRSIAPQVKKLSPSGIKGGGFLFGASLDLSARINLALVSAELKAGCGFDVIVKNYGENARCAGSNETLGINGWYAMGQMYAYMEGSIKVSGIEILSAGFAAVLQAQLPNPFYAQATVGVKYKLLFTQKSTSFKVKFGDFCDIQADENLSPAQQALGMKIFSSITPNTDSKEMETDVKPLIYCNIPFEKEFESGVNLYKVKLKQSNIISLKNGYKYSHVAKWNESNDEFELIADQIFAGFDSVRVEVVAQILKNGEHFVYDTISTSFTLGKKFEGIPDANVEYTYPLNGMVNFHKEENNRYQGVIQLVSGMPELFYNIPEKMDQVVKLQARGEEPIYFDYYYDGLQGSIKLPMDPGLIQNEKIYRLSIVRLPKNSFTKTIPQKGIDVGNQVGGLNLNSLSGYPNDSSSDSNTDSNGSESESTLFTLFFRTSKFSTVADKFLSMNLQGDKILLQENFDKFDLDNLYRISFEGDDAIEESEKIINESDENKFVKVYSNEKTYSCQPKLKFDDDLFEEILQKSGPINSIQIPISGVTYLKGFPSSLNINTGTLSFTVVHEVNRIYADIGTEIDICLNKLGQGQISFDSPLDRVFYNNLPVLPRELTLKYVIPGFGSSKTIKVNF